MWVKNLVYINPLPLQGRRSLIEGIKMAFLPPPASCRKCIGASYPSYKKCLLTCMICNCDNWQGGTFEPLCLHNN